MSVWTTCRADGDNPRGARHWAHLHAANGCTVKDRHLPRRRSVVESVARAHPLTAVLMPAETSHSVAVHRAASTTIPHSGGHRAREGGSTLYIGISQPLFATVRPPGSNAADQASWNSR